MCKNHFSIQICKVPEITNLSSVVIRTNMRCKFWIYRENFQYAESMVWYTKWHNINGWKKKLKYQTTCIITLNISNRVPGTLKIPSLVMNRMTPKSIFVHVFNTNHSFKANHNKVRPMHFPIKSIIIVKVNAYNHSDFWHVWIWVIPIL